MFAESVDTPERAAAYRAAFAEVAHALRAAGLRVDEHGATPSSPEFARTRQEWRRAAQQWLASPLENQGMLMASLLIDGRPIQGDPAASVVGEVFADAREHPGTMRLLVQESLSHKAQLRSVRDVLAGRGGTFDLKQHALRPVVEIARWAALGVRATDLSTRSRLAAASGSMLLPTEQASTLIEVFEVLQRVRLRQQLAQLERGQDVTDRRVDAQAPTAGPQPRRAVGARDLDGAEAAVQHHPLHVTRGVERHRRCGRRGHAALTWPAARRRGSVLSTRWRGVCPAVRDSTGEAAEGVRYQCTSRGPSPHRGQLCPQT